jgi:hypothetical protein
VREADTPPSVPVVPVAQLEQDLIEMFRQYSQLSGGPFPKQLDMVSLVHVLFRPKSSQKEGQNPSAKQMPGNLTIMALEFQPGLTFAASLPPEADAHYAGRGVSLGAADKPIFWYRPKDNKK